MRPPSAGLDAFEAPWLVKSHPRFWCAVYANPRCRRHLPQPSDCRPFPAPAIRMDSVRMANSINPMDSEEGSVERELATLDGEATSDEKAAVGVVDERRT